MSAQLSLLDVARNERQRILAALAANHQDYLRGVRAIARKIALRDGEVTIDDVRAEMLRTGYPMPEEVKIDARVFGALFASGDFVALGSRATARKDRAVRFGRNRSAVTVYALR